MTMPASRPTRMREAIVRQATPGPSVVDDKRRSDHDHAGEDAAGETEAERGLCDRNEVERAVRLARLVREDGDEPDGRDRVERDREHARALTRGAVELPARELR